MITHSELTVNVRCRQSMMTTLSDLELAKVGFMMPCSATSAHYLKPVALVVVVGGVLIDLHTVSANVHTC